MWRDEIDGITLHPGLECRLIELKITNLQELADFVGTDPFEAALLAEKDAIANHMIGGDVLPVLQFYCALGFSLADAIKLIEGEQIPGKRGPMLRLVR